MNKPFFSVVLPVYGVEKYLDRCVESIIAQDFTDFEIILVDDGSKDNCPALCDEWSRKDKRIKTIHKQNAGLGMARNTGLDAASGEYIFFVDSDDYILPGMLSQCKEKIEETGCDIVFYGYKRMSKTGDVLLDLVPGPEKELYDDKEEIKNKLLCDFLGRDPYKGISRGLRISVCTCCMNIEMLRANNLRFVSEREYISEDIYFYLELFSNLSKVVFIKESFYCYCQNEGSLTFSYKEDRFERQKKFYLDSVELVKGLGYDSKVILMQAVPFISNVMSCLKMEVANKREVGLKACYKKIKGICCDEVFYKAVSEYPSDKLVNSWKLFSYCIRHKLILVLMLKMFIQFYLRGI